MKIKFIILVNVLIILSACEVDKNNSDTIKPELNKNFDDSEYIQDSLYKKGDVRRYGVYPNKSINSKLLKKVIELADNGLPMIFPEGNYNTNIRIEGLKDLKLSFNNAKINGSFYIIEKDTISSQRIKLTGKLTILDKLFIRKSNTISFDTLLVLSDTINNISRLKNRGVSIYAGSKNIHFNKLEISNTGGSMSKHFKFTAASLQIHGWNDNPEYITVNDLVINNAERTALYLTGNHHQFNKVNINNFGFGSANNMFGLEDATPGEERKFAGVWINKCNDCKIDTLEINNVLKKELFSLKLGIGEYHQPTFINNIHFTTDAKKLPILDDELTNILVKNEY